MVPRNRAIEMEARTGVGGGGEGCTRYHVWAVVIPGMTVDPRIPAVLGRGMSGFHRPGRHCLLAPSAKRNVRVFGDSREGCAVSYYCNQEPLVRRTCLWTTASMRSCNFWCGHFRRQQWGYCVSASWVPCHKHYAIRSLLLCEVKVLRPA